MPAGMSTPNLLVHTLLLAHKAIDLQIEEMMSLSLGSGWVSQSIYLGIWSGPDHKEACPVSPVWPGWEKR